LVGNDRLWTKNTKVMSFVVTGLNNAPRTIVTFDVDANGMLNLTAISGKNLVFALAVWFILIPFGLFNRRIKMVEALRRSHLYPLVPIPN
jgi:hypothetical protein